MRLKLQTVPPLLPLKAWFATDGLEPVPASIADLKKHLLSNVERLKSNAGAKVISSHLVLTLDDFELLDESSLATLRDGDLISVGLPAQTFNEECHLGKRKRSNAGMPPTSVRARNAMTESSSSPTSVSSSNSQSETSSSDDNSSNESDSTDSSSDSSSGLDTSDSEPDSTHVPPVQSSKVSLNYSSSLPQPKHRPSVVAPNLRNTIQSPHVPPGHGLPRTQSRNRRKRQTRLVAKLKNAGPSAPLGSSSSNLVPLGNRPAQPSFPVSRSGVANTGFAPCPHLITAQCDQIVPGVDCLASTSSSNDPHASDIISMASLRNKNKKKGFKNLLSRPRPEKIIFERGAEAVNAANSFCTSSSGEQSEVLAALLPESKQPATSMQLGRLVPPSEKQANGAIPVNIFVTKIDVEGGIWTSQSQDNEVQSKPGLSETTNLRLDYGTISPAQRSHTMNPRPESAPRSFNWNAAESHYANGQAIEVINQLQIGMLVGWKALAINPSTCTPEFLLSVARVVSLSPPSITIKELIRPGTSGLSFFRNSEENGDDATDEIEQAMGDVEDVSWDDVVTNGWRTLLI